ncbi:hypothetical protein KP509_1Z248900, partial [Ceratopteris richardii]
MSTNYNVFICHRGPDTKHNIVSVLEGMLRSNGITCFVDYRMDEGNDVNVSIRNAIDISLVHIVILSPTFNTSSWCLDEALRIIEIQKTSIARNIFYGWSRFPSREQREILHRQHKSSEFRSGPLHCFKKFQN